AHPSCVLMSAFASAQCEVANFAKEEPKYFACRRRKIASVRSFRVLGSEILDVGFLHARRICDSSTRNEMRSCSAVVSHVSTNSSRDARLLLKVDVPMQGSARVANWPAGP